uniref:RDR3 n=1 Tax=Arundo donax TaxID=35708 RepID=A0A0A9EME6_ARUDO
MTNKCWMSSLNNLLSSWHNPAFWHHCVNLTNSIERPHCETTASNVHTLIPNTNCYNRSLLVQRGY